jgi:hypothetical protein
VPAAALSQILLTQTVRSTKARKSNLLPLVKRTEEAQTDILRDNEIGGLASRAAKNRTSDRSFSLLIAPNRATSSGSV